MKKFTAILLTLVLALSLAACGSDTTTASDGEGTTAPATEPQDTTTQEDTNAGTASVDTGRTLVVYFSATGNTQTAAETIADLAGGDLFPLEPADPYTDEDLNWTDESSRVVGRPRSWMKPARASIPARARASSLCPSRGRPQTFWANRRNLGRPS